MFGTSRNPKNSSCATRHLLTKPMQNDNCSLFYMFVHRHRYVLVTYFKMKTAPDVSCYITSNLIRHDLNYFILNIMTHKFLFSFVSSNLLIVECFLHGVFEALSLVVSELRSETKGSRFESGR